VKQIRPYVFVGEGNVNIAYFEELPGCDFCGEPARYDAETDLPRHPAAYFCKHCFLIYARMPPPWLTILEKRTKVEYHSDAVPVITIPLTTETLYWPVYVLCPHCGTRYKRVGIDSEGIWTCECCGNQYMLRNELDERWRERWNENEEKYEDHPPKWLEEYFDEILLAVFKDYPNQKKRRANHAQNQKRNDTTSRTRNRCSKAK